MLPVIGFCSITERAVQFSFLDSGDRFTEMPRPHYTSVPQRNKILITVPAAAGQEVSVDPR
jgi:hypothetical protein